jgi:hypothetical protein
MTNKTRLIFIVTDNFPYRLFIENSVLASSVKGSPDKKIRFRLPASNIDIPFSKIQDHIPCKKNKWCIDNSNLVYFPDYIRKKIEDEIKSFEKKFDCDLVLPRIRGMVVHEESQGNQYSIVISLVRSGNKLNYRKDEFSLIPFQNLPNNLFKLEDIQILTMSMIPNSYFVITFNKFTIDYEEYTSVEYIENKRIINSLSLNILSSSETRKDPVRPKDDQGQPIQNQPE